MYEITESEQVKCTCISKLERTRFTISIIILYCSTKVKNRILRVKSLFNFSPKCPIPSQNISCIIFSTCVATLPPNLNLRWSPVMCICSHGLSQDVLSFKSSPGNTCIHVSRLLYYCTVDMYIQWLHSQNLTVHFAIKLLIAFNLLFCSKFC